VRIAPTSTGCFVEWPATESPKSCACKTLGKRVLLWVPFVPLSSRSTALVTHHGTVCTRRGTPCQGEAKGQQQRPPNTSKGQVRSVGFRFARACRQQPMDSPLTGVAFRLPYSQSRSRDPRRTGGSSKRYGRSDSQSRAGLPSCGTRHSDPSSLESRGGTVAWG